MHAPRNIADWRERARRRLPAPVFHYIDGAAEDESTYRRNTAAFERQDLVPRVLADVSEVDMSVDVMGHKMQMPLFCSPTALQRLFHHEGEAAVARAAADAGTLFGISSLATASLAEIAALTDAPKIFQFYFHKDRALNDAMLAAAREAKFDILMLTVDTPTGGNRERDLATGFTSPPRLTAQSLASFATHPAWSLRYLLSRRFALPQLEAHVAEGSKVAVTVGEYFSTMLEQAMDWDDAARLREAWGGRFCLKGVMSADDARRAVQLGADAVVISNHGGRQLDGARAPFDQVAELADAVGDETQLILDGGIRRGSHVLKALAAGAHACSGGRFYLYALAAAGTRGVAHALRLMRDEIERDMKLMGIASLAELNRSCLRQRP